MDYRGNQNQNNIPKRPAMPQRAPRQQQGRAENPRQNPPPPTGARRPGMSETRPLDPYPGYTPEYREPRRKKKGSKILPVLLTLLVIAGIAAAVYFLLIKGNRNKVGPETVKLYENTNAFRSATVSAEGAVVDFHNALAGLPLSFIDSDAVQLLEDPEDVQTFIDNEASDDYVEQQHPTTMGRLIIPSIGTNGPLCDDSTEQTLYYGFGVVPFMKDISEEGLNVILGHRVLTRDAGMLYMGEMQPGDPFYIDDYRSGTRYVYETIKNENVDYDEYLNRFVAEGSEPYPGQISMLVTCDPYIYGSSERRILVYGKVIKTIDIPDDDPHYLRYRGE